MQVTVIICTHNPREDYFRRTLDSLRAQMLPKDQWELLLVDNASKEPLEGRWDLSWHCHGRHIREMELGLTPARLRGVVEAQSELLIFIDDDCELDVDYLSLALDISRRYPFLGAWGGQCIPCFEQEPPAWTKPFWTYLTIRVFSHERWSNFDNDGASTPWGAGLCVRLPVAKVYRQRVNTEPLLKQLGRKGAQLLSCEDLDLALTACEVGQGIGVFPQLKLRHLIPTNRIQEDYLLRAVEGNAYSMLIMGTRRGNPVSRRQIGKYRSHIGHFRRLLTMPRLQRLFFEARLRGEQKALGDIRSFGLIKETAPSPARP